MRTRRLAGAAVAAWALVALRSGRSHLSGDAEGAEHTTRADDGVLLHVQVDGNPDADLTVVLVHGYGSSLHVWRYQRPALAPHVRLVLFDHRGHGRSGWAHPRRSTVEQMAGDLRAVLRDHAADGPVVLVGHSLGGIVGLALAAEHPEVLGTAVCGVALLSASAGRIPEIVLPPLLSPLVGRTRVAALSVWPLWAVAPLIDRLAPLRSAPGRRLLRRLLFHGPEVDGADVETAIEDASSTPVSVLLALAPSLLHHHRAAVVDRLRALPVLVLAGRSDALIPVVHSQRIAEGLRGHGELVLVEGAGHLVNVTHPAEVSAAVLRLVESVRAAAAS